MQITITRSLVQTNTKQAVLSRRWFAIYYLTTVLDVHLSRATRHPISPSHRGRPPPCTIIPRLFDDLLESKREKAV